jgi:phytol kinase
MIARISGNSSFERAEPLTWMESVIVRLGPQEFRRRLWHFVPGVLALLGAATPCPASWLVYSVSSMVILATALTLFAIYWQHAIRRTGEQNCLAAILGYAVTVIPLFLFFPSRPELALTVAGILAFGDGSASLVGMLAAGTKLPWNQRKSWAGTIAFVLVAVPTATAIYWCESIPHASFETAVFCVLPAILASAIAETLPTRFNDNLFVGASAAVALIAMQGLVVGWP